MKVTTSSTGKAPFRWSWEISLQRLGLLIFILIVLGPLLVLIADVVPSLVAGHSDWLQLAIPSGRRLVLLLNSLGFAAAVAVAGVILGTLGASIMWRWDTGGRSYLRWLVVILAPIPPYIHALAWTSAIYAINSRLQSMGIPAIPVQGGVIAWWIQLMSLAPIAVGLALVGLKSVEPKLIDTARMIRSDMASLAKVILSLTVYNLISYITAVGMMPEAPSLTETVDGLRILVKAGLLKEIRTDSYGLSKAIEPLVRLTVGQPSGVQWQRVSLMDNGEQIISNRMFLFADRSLMLCLASTVKGRLFISRVRRKEITDFLADEIMTTLTPTQQKVSAPRGAAAPRPAVIPPPAVAPRPAAMPPPPMTHRPAAVPPPVAAPRPITPASVMAPRPAVVPTPAPVVAPAAATAMHCIQCGAELRPNVKFCAKCGASVVAPKATSASVAAICPNCGQNLKPGAKFCSRCGAVVSGQTAVPKPAVCPKCGRPLKPGAKFCSGCGTQL